MSHQKFREIYYIKHKLDIQVIIKNLELMNNKNFMHLVLKSDLNDILCRNPSDSESKILDKFIEYSYIITPETL